MDHIAYFFAKERFAQGGLVADQAFQGITADGGHDLVILFRAVIDKFHGNGVVDTYLIRCGVLGDDLCSLDHSLQITDAALILILILFGCIVFKILTEIAVGSGFLHVLQCLGTYHQLAVLDLFFHFLNVSGG